MDRAFYSEIKKILTNARDKVYQTANFTMVEAYWQIGKSIVKEQNGEERAEYGTGLLKELSKHSLTHTLLTCANCGTTETRGSRTILIISFLCKVCLHVTTLIDNKELKRLQEADNKPKKIEN